MDENNVYIIMERNPESNHLEKEIAKYKIITTTASILNIYARNNSIFITLDAQIPEKKTIEDWEYDAIYDYYDHDIFKSLTTSIKELEDTLNPTWELELPLLDNTRQMEENLNSLIILHEKEIQDVYDTISTKKGDYIDQ